MADHDDSAAEKGAKGFFEDAKGKAKEAVGPPEGQPGLRSYTRIACRFEMCQRRSILRDRPALSRRRSVRVNRLFDGGSDAGFRRWTSG